jgi:hypothetical protein
MAPAVHDTCARIYAEGAGVTAEEAETWLATQHSPSPSVAPPKLKHDTEQQCVAGVRGSRTGSRSRAAC